MNDQTNKIDISKLDKAEVLAALYNNSRQLGMGFMHSRGREPMTAEQAREEIAGNTHERYDGRRSIYFDYLHGRVMKVELGSDSFDPWLYDRDNGRGSALAALAPLIAKVAA
jgi:hypothetical protein